MKKPIILHDIDGVIRNFDECAFDFVKKKYPKIKKYIKPKNKVDGWSIENFITDERLVPFLHKVFFENPKTSYEIFYNASSLISPIEWLEHYKWLKKENYNVTLCSAQFGDHMKIATINWIRENNIVYDDIILVNESESKHIYGDIILDDKPMTIEDFNKVGKPAVIKKRYYNKKYINNNNILVANSLKDFRNHIKKIFK